MGYDERREILERLEELERRLRSGTEIGVIVTTAGEAGGTATSIAKGADTATETGTVTKAVIVTTTDMSAEAAVTTTRSGIIDTIVRLVSENVGRMIESRQESSRREDRNGDEKRMVDLVVGLIAEKVQEIVSTELDRRLDRAEIVAIPPPSRSGFDDSEEP